MRHTPCGYRVGPPTTDATPVVPHIRPYGGTFSPTGAPSPLRGEGYALSDEILDHRLPPPPEFPRKCVFSLYSRAEL